MNWKLLRAFPKWAIAFGAFAGSTALFALWWYTRPKATALASIETPLAAVASTPKEERRKKAELLPERMGWLALVGHDLYDVGTGELLIPNWLNFIPKRLLYQQESKRLIAETERGFIRFKLDGSQDGTLGGDAPPSLTHNKKQATYVKDGDIWVAEMNWPEFRYVNERQVTHLGQFSAPFYAANVILASEKALIVKAQNALLRVNLLTGGVEPIVLTLDGLGKRRSPDGQFLVGEYNGQIYAYDVNNKEAAMLPRGRDAILDYQWLGNDRCAFVVAGKGVGLYDRKINALEEVTALPFPCNKMAGPSPDGRFVMCAGGQGVAIVDALEKKAETFGPPAQHFAWLNNETLVYSRSTPDMSTRGVWLRTMGHTEQKIMAEPYVVGRDGMGVVAEMREVNLVLFAARDSLFRMKPDGAQLQEVAKLPAPVQRIQAVEIWADQ